MVRGTVAAVGLVALAGCGRDDLPHDRATAPGIEPGEKLCSPPA